MSMQACWASRDTAALREAIWSYLTEVPLQRTPPGAGRRAPQESRAKRAALPYAFELWIAHLALVEQVLEMAPVGWQELPAAELEGILLLRAARDRMRREYRACAECGGAVKGKICPRCGAVGK
jgi:hypothetical protein